MGGFRIMLKSIVFMDYDNVWISCSENYKINILDINFVSKLMEHLHNKDYFITEVIAYGNFDNGRMASDRHQTMLQMSGVQTRHVMNGKDSADIAIVCDALEKLYLTNPDIDVFVIVTCDRDITSLINKIKSRGKIVYLIPLTINIDWDVMKNYNDDYDWFEKIIKIEYQEPTTKTELDEDTFMKELSNEERKRTNEINLSLFSNSVLLRKYSTTKSNIGDIVSRLIKESKVELYEYVFRNKKYHDGIRIKTDNTTLRSTGAEEA